MSVRFVSRLRTDAFAPNYSIRPGEFVVTAPFIVELRKQFRITVPSGFITDFASIPGPVRLMPGMDPNGQSRPAAVLHDYLYCMQGLIGMGDVSVVAPSVRVTQLTRRDCDAIFHEALAACRVNAAIADLMYLGVRIGGWRYWNKRDGGVNTTDFVPPDYFNGEETEQCGA